jgi:hypothetical protein
MKKYLSVLKEEVNRFQTGQEDEGNKKIKVLDNIIGKKMVLPQRANSPRMGNTRSSSLLQDIEASLSRVKLIASPALKN